jgi:hypothetical protein
MPRPLALRDYPRSGSLRKDQSIGAPRARRSKQSEYWRDEAGFKRSAIDRIIQHRDAANVTIVSVSFFVLGSDLIEIVHPREGPGPW